jgi:hypothetical protein
MNGGFVVSFQEDRASIIRILRFTRNLLEHLISRIPEEQRRRFTAAWERQIRASIDEVIHQVETIEAEDSPTWTLLAEAGLSGPSLELKRYLLASAFGGGLLRRFLRLLNIFLGSLAGAIPGVHGVKELKELLEEFLPDEPEPDEEIIRIFGAAPF